MTNQILTVVICTWNRLETNRLKPTWGLLGNFIAWESTILPLKSSWPRSRSRIQPHTCRKGLCPQEGHDLECCFRWTRQTLPKGKVKGHIAGQPREVPLESRTRVARCIHQATHSLAEKKVFQFLPGRIWSLLWYSDLCVFFSSPFWMELFYNPAPICEAVTYMKSWIYLHHSGKSSCSYLAIAYWEWESWGGASLVSSSCHTTWS